MPNKTVLDDDAKGKFACLLFDSTMKTILGTQAHADLFIDILELLLPEKHISSITMLNKEYHGLNNSEKRATFDLLCRDDDTGEEFLVELQNANKTSFRERVLFYSYFPIREQLERKRNILTKEARLDKMDYSINPVYVVSLVNFALDHEYEGTLENNYVSCYGVCNKRTGEVLTNALNFVFLEMGRLPYSKDEAYKCRDRIERFVFSLKYMHTFEEFPSEFEEDPMLKKMAEAARLANLPMDQLLEYESAMRTEIDRWAERSYATNKGRAEGKAEGIAKGIAQGRAEGIVEGKAKGKAEDARAMLADGMSPALVSKYTGLSEEQIAALQ